MEARILHISDVQFGDLCLARPKDTNKPESIVSDPLFKSLFNALKDKWPKPQLIALSGDITTRAAPNEFLQAEAFLQTLSKIWGDPPVEYFLVPGNHDVSWDISGLDSADSMGFKGIRFAPYLLCALREPFETAAPHYLRYNESADFIHHHTASDASICIVGINSAVTEDKSSKIHHGHISDQQVALAKARFQGAAASYKVLALHHHLRPLKDPPAWTDYSTATNAQAITDIFSELQVDLVLHGHRHRPNYDTHISSSWCTHIFGAGSLATVPSERNQGDVRCSAHLITLKGKVSGIAFGEIRTIKMFGGAGDYKWESSEDGFPGVIRFGKPLMKAEIPNHLIRILGTPPKTGSIGEQLAADPTLHGADIKVLQQEVNAILSTHGLILTETSSDISQWKAYRL